MLLNCDFGEDKSPLDSKEIQPFHPKGNQSWIFFGRTDTEAETPILWPPDVKNWIIWKDPDAGKDWRQEEKEDRGWDGWMASPTQWTWVWVKFRNWWYTESMGLQAVGHNRATELNWNIRLKSFRCFKMMQIIFEWHLYCSLCVLFFYIHLKLN